MEDKDIPILQFTTKPLVGVVGLENIFPSQFKNNDQTFQDDSTCAPERHNESFDGYKNERPAYKSFSDCMRTSSSMGLGCQPYQPKTSPETAAASTLSQPSVRSIQTYVGYTIALKACNFCISNRESRRFSHSHNLREMTPDGQLILTCPVLRKYTCEFCGASGDSAHTRTHCPVVIAENGGVKPEPLVKLLNKSLHMPCGRRRVLKMKN